MKKLMALGMGLLVGGALGSPAFASASKGVDVQSVQAQIAHAHAGWRAKTTWVSRLSSEALHQLLGLKELPKGQLDFSSPGLKGLYPASVDWRNHGGVNYLGAVMNQGNCGSCVAFATVATLEAQVSIATGSPWLRPTFSPQELFSCGGGGCQFGWMPDNAADFLQNQGITDAACMPYTSGSTGEDVACSDRCADADSRAMRIASYTTPTSYGGSVEEVKAALQHGPLVTTLGVYEDFLTYSGGVYKHVTGKLAGGHAVSLVGYDDAKHAWLIRNSWGEEWGEKGFAWVSWDDTSGIGANTWSFDIAPQPGQLGVTAPRDAEYVSGSYVFKAQSNGLRGNDVQFHLKDSSGRDALVSSCTGSGGTCSSVVDTTHLREGRYEIYAESASSGVKSQIREFYVINSAPKMSISFTGHDVDLTAPLHDRPEFDLTVQSSPVPMQHIEFRAIDSQGKIVSVKGDDLVLDRMRMGWRTISVPSGRYTILFHGETTWNGKVYGVDSNSMSVTVQN